MQSSANPIVPAPTPSIPAAQATNPNQNINFGNGVTTRSLIPVII